MGDVRLARDEVPGISTLLNDPMKEEIKRRETFPQPLSENDNILASKGFFAPFRLPSQVQCFSCGIGLDYPLPFPVFKIDSEHKRRSPSCDFVSGRSGNVPVVPGHEDQDGNNVPPAITSGTPAQSNRVTSVIEPANRISLPNLSRTEPSTLYNRHTVNYELMKSEQERLNTFFGIPSWPVSFISPVDCAHAGFFFLQESDKVQCAFCRGVAGEWEEGDVPMMEHRRHFPRCPFICNLPVGNIPIGEEESDEASSDDMDPQQLGIDICGPFEPDTLRLTLLQDGGHVGGAQPLTGSLDNVAANLAITTCRGPTHLHMVTLPSRLKSYAGWPTSTGQAPEVMAKAGFYYVGAQDHVKCFYCGGGLRNWEARDDPWVEHARWFPKCTFVVLNKGEDFIKSVLRTSLQVRNSHSSNQPAGARFSSSDEEDLERPCKNDLKAVPSSSSSGIGTASSSSDICSRSPRGSTSSSGNSSGEEDTETSEQKPSKEKYLEEEVRKLREARQCKICMDNEVSVVFLPCGHLVSCTSCATAFTNCALCRQPIKGVVRTYMS